MKKKDDNEPAGGGISNSGTPGRGAGAVSSKGRVQRWRMGVTPQGRTWEAFAFAPEGMLCPEQPSEAPWPWFLLLAGVHGDEVEGIWVAEKMVEGLLEGHPLAHVGVVVVVEANPDGTALGTRGNAQGVDLNRNLPTRDWSPEASQPRYAPGPHAGSEPESLFLLSLLDRVKPFAILSLHSFRERVVNSNGPALPWAQALGALCECPVNEDMGYPTPGSLGTYAGWERGIPTITLEILRGMSIESVLGLYVMATMVAVGYWDERYDPSLRQFLKA